MAEIRIEIDGVSARLVEGQWITQDKDLAQLLRDRATMVLQDGRHYPDPDLAVAQDAADAFLGKIVHIDPLHRPAERALRY